MKKVTLSNTNGETKEINVKFSFPYLLLGPIYYFAKVMIIRGLILLALYTAVILACLTPFIELLQVPFLESHSNLSWWLIGVLLVVHLLLAFITPRALIRKLFKKGYVPYAEIDTQILIKYNLAKVGTLCYLSSFKAVDGVQGKIKMGNSKNLEKELDELKQLLKEGMLTKDEYETKRAMAIMRSGNKKK